MNRFIPAAVNSTLLFRMSHNAEYYPRAKGKFEVQYNNVHRKRFSTLLEAFLFYFTLEEEAVLWDKTTNPTPIEAKVMLCLN